MGSSIFYSGRYTEDPLGYIVELEKALLPFAREYALWGVEEGKVFIRGDGDDSDDLAEFQVEDLKRAYDLLNFVQIEFKME